MEHARGKVGDGSSYGLCIARYGGKAFGIGVKAHATTELAIANLMKNAKRAHQILVSAIDLIGKSRPLSKVHTVLKTVLVTSLKLDA